MSPAFELRPLELITRDPFTIARGGSEHWRNIYLRLEVDGLVGRGEGAPREYYGESVEEGIRALRGWLESQDRLDEESASDRLDAQKVETACKIP